MALYPQGRWRNFLIVGFDFDEILSFFVHNVLFRRTIVSFPVLYSIVAIRLLFPGLLYINHYGDEYIDKSKCMCYPFYNRFLLIVTCTISDYDQGRI